MEDYEKIIAEIQDGYSPFFEFTWDLIKDLCEYAKLRYYDPEWMDLRREYQWALTREYEIRPILAECKKILA